MFQDLPLKPFSLQTSKYPPSKPQRQKNPTLLFVAVQFAGWGVTRDITAYWLNSSLDFSTFTFCALWRGKWTLGGNVSSPRFSPCRAIDEISGQADKSISPKVKMANIVQIGATQMESRLLFPTSNLADLVSGLGGLLPQCSTIKSF